MGGVTAQNPTTAGKLPFTLPDLSLKNKPEFNVSAQTNHWI